MSTLEVNIYIYSKSFLQRYLYLYSYLKIILLPETQILAGVIFSPWHVLPDRHLSSSEGHTVDWCDAFLSAHVMEMWSTRLSLTGGPHLPLSVSPPPPGRLSRYEGACMLPHTCWSSLGSALLFCLLYPAVVWVVLLLNDSGMSGRGRCGPPVKDRRVDHISGTWADKKASHQSTVWPSDEEGSLSVKTCQGEKITSANICVCGKRKLFRFI